MTPARPIRLLVLGSAFDALSQAVADRIRRRHGAAAVMHKTLEDLADARWRHRFGAAGVTSEVSFSDGESISIPPPMSILNRLDFVPTLLFNRMKPIDRDYARAEFFALLLSWLEGFGDRVLNRPAPSGLSGPRLRTWQWIALAAKAGFMPHPVAATTSARCAPSDVGDMTRADLLSVIDDDALDRLGFDRPRATAPAVSGLTTLLVFGARVLTETGQVCDPELSAPCLRLADAVRAEILAVQVASAGWRFLCADACPQINNPALIDALADWIDERP